MYSLHMSFIHLVKLSTVVWKSTQVNFMMLNTRLMMLSEGGRTTHKLLQYFTISKQQSHKLNFSGGSKENGGEKKQQILYVHVKKLCKLTLQNFTEHTEN